MPTHNPRKKARVLHWTPERNGVSPAWWDGQSGLDLISVNMHDPNEPDRLTKLHVTEDDAVFLAARIAHHVGYKLVEDD